MGALEAKAQIATTPRFSAPGASATADSPDPDAPRVIEGIDTVSMEEMTWMEIRDAMKGRKDTVIVATGGLATNLGIIQVDEGLHADYAISSIMAVVGPTSIPLPQRAAKGNARRMVEHRVEVTIAGLGKAMDQHCPLPGFKEAR